jgi:integrase/recombinase XerD
MTNKVTPASTAIPMAKVTKTKSAMIKAASAKLPTLKTPLPVAEWPALDRTAWLNAKAPADIFDAPHRGDTWAPASWRKAEVGYGRWLRWLTLHHPEQLTLPPEARLTEAHLRGWHATLTTTLAPMSQLSLVEDVTRAMSILAPKLKPSSPLTRLHANLRASATPSRNKRQRLVMADVLRDLGRDMMTEARTINIWSDRRRAVAFRDGLAISLLVYRPFRLKNFASLRIGHELVQSAGKWHLVLPREDTKNNRPHEARFPKVLLGDLATYLDRFRPILLAGEAGCTQSGTDALWVSEIGTAWESGALSHRIADLTEARLNRRIPPHWFRDVAATTIAVEAPRNIADAHLLLGHASHLTTQKHYIQAQSLQAGAKFQAAMLERLNENHTVTTKEAQ